MLNKKDKNKIKFKFILKYFYGQNISDDNLLIIYYTIKLLLIFSCDLVVCLKINYNHILE